MPSRGGAPRSSQPTMDKPKREAILDLSKYVNERIRVKFTGGREGASLRQTLILAHSLIIGSQLLVY